MSIQQRPVFWDGFGFQEKYSGIATYTREMREAYPQFLAEPTLIRPDKVSGKKWARSYPGSKLLWPVYAYQKAVRDAGHDDIIFHGLSNINLPVISSRTRSRFVITLHDLIPLLPGSGVSISLGSQFRIALPKVLKRADRIVCVSEWTKETLEQKYPWAAQKAVVIPNGSGYRNLTAAPGKACLVKNFEEKKYVVLGTVSRFEPYKRIHWIPELLMKLPKIVRWKVVTCESGSRFLRNHCGQFIDRGQLTVETHLTDRELPDYYGSLDYYVHLSRYEGYGLPVWEALSYQKSVVWQMGSGLNQLRDFRYGVALPESSTLDTWAQVLRELKPVEGTIDREGFEASLEPLCSSWEGAAKALIQVYNSLN